ncbi:MAG: ABC transporter substrate-binding protein [Proteobacteria bacterium]|nr:ABC transporter substrate-binding protein [Pseudomonadota bacterium]
MHRTATAWFIGTLALFGAAAPAAAQGTLRIGMTAADIPLITGQPDQGFEGYRFGGYTVYDGLANWDMSSATKTSDIVPGLATSWTVDPADQKKWTIKLRRGVSFHDGSPFNADAVIWNCEKIFNDKSPQYDPKQVAQVAARIPSMESYRKIDDDTVEYRTRVVNGLFPYELSYMLFSSPKQWEAVGKDWAQFALKPSGTGPFKVTAVVQREKIELVRNDGYWDAKRVPKLDKVVLLPMPEATTRTAALLSGQVDWIEVPAPDAIAKLRSAGMQIVLNSYPHNWGYQPSMIDGSPWLDLRVRKAANLALDRDALKTLLGGTMEISKGQVQPDHPWFGKPAFDIKYDPAEAKRLLAEAGYSTAKPVQARIAISTSGSGQMQPLAMNEFIQQQLKEVGIALDFEVYEWNALTNVARLTADAPEMTARKISGINVSRAFLDPYLGFARLFHSAYLPPRGGNWGKLKDDVLDGHLDKVFSSFDPAEQAEAMRAAHTRMVDQAYWLWVAHDLNPRAMSPKVQGFVQARNWFQDLTPVSMK